MSKGTARHTVRVDPGLWEAALAVAESRGTNLSAVIREALRGYIKEGET